MPRRARKYNETNFFHIIVQGINKEYIFNNERYIRQYLKFLFKYRENTNIEIIAYCIMNNHAHLLLYTEKIDEMSKYMHKVNTGYAKYYNFMCNNRVGYVFRDRYVSEPIQNERYLIKCINYIHYNPVKADMVKHCKDYKYSSYNEFMNGKQMKILTNVLGVSVDIELFRDGKSNDIFEDLEIDKREIIQTKLKDLLSISNISIEDALKDRVILRILVRILKYRYRIKYVDMMKVLNLTKGQMEGLKKYDF